jgi:type VI secretion system protein ImpE
MMVSVTMQVRAGATLAQVVGGAMDAVRKAPAQAALRIRLFQLFSVQGEWGRALAQLAACARLDPACEEMARVYREVIRCEAFRAEVFAGRRAPLLLGEPAPWLAQLLEALRLDASGAAAAAAGLRAQALEAAPALRGSIDGARFAWLADADSRLGPVLEAIVNGKYYWIPFHQLHAVESEPPADLRDLAWLPARLTFANGGEQVAFVPVRYPDPAGADDALLMARRTEWRELAPGSYGGVGQRMFASEAGEYALLDVRRIEFESPAVTETGDA